jgi:Domain of unknown function (DUF4382)
VRKRIPLLLILPVVLAFIASCGGSSHHTTPPSEVPVIVSISDQPSNEGVLSFDIQITSACLLTSANATATSCSGAQSLITSPVTVQLENLQTSQAPDVLANTQAPAGTYTNVLIIFGTATAAVNVDPGTTANDSVPNSCTAGATPTVCELSPTVSPTFVNVPFSTAAVLTAGQPANIAIDFNVASSLVAATVGTTNTFSIDPSVTVTDNTTALADGNLLDVGPITGTVTAVGANSLTVTDSTTGQPVTIAINTGTNPTTFNGFGSCTAANLSCVQANQVVTVNSTFANTSPLTQTATSVTDNGGIAFGQGFEGTVIQTGATPMILVTSVPAGNTQNVTVGETLTLVPPATSAGFSVALPAGQTLPAGVSFAGAGDLVDGQNVLIDSTGVVTTGGISTSTADQVVLEPTQFNGTLASITSPNVTVNGLNNFFTDNNVQNINFETGPQTTFGGTVATTGFGGLTVGDQTDMNGFLFNGGVGQNPVVFGETLLDNGVVPAQGMKTKK